MPFTLIMKRKVFRVIQDICDEYEERFKERIPTAHVVNVLIAEALIARGLIPKDYIRQKYGCDNPIEQGFTPNARKEVPSTLAELEERERKLELERAFADAIAEWPKRSDLNWRLKWVAYARKHMDTEGAKRLLELAGEIRNE